MAETSKRTDLNFNEFRKLLLDERAQLTGLDRDLRADIIDESREGADNDKPGAYSVGEGAENADSGAILADLERTKVADETVKETLRQIEAALTRLDDGTYGLDEVTGEPIPVARLRALPWATMTVETAERVGP